MYKLSRFNVLLEENKENLIYFNTFSKKYIKIIDSTMIDKKITFENLAENSQAYKKLVSLKFLVDEHYDEDLACDELYYRETLGDTSLWYTVIPTRDCNFNCIYCAQPHVKKTMDEESIVLITRSLKKRLKNYSSFILSFFGGEPLLEYEKCIKLLDESITVCRKLSRNFTAYMTTNGYLLTEDRFRELLNRHVIYYHITIDGSPSVHDTHRPLSDGSPSFLKILENLINIKNNIKSNTFHITLRTNISKEIYENIDEFIEILSTHFKHDKRFNIYWRWMEDFGGERVKDHQSNFVDINMVNDATRKAVDAGLVLYNDTIYNAKKGALVCEASKENYYVIDYDMSLLKCTHWDKPEHTKIGNILKTGDFKINRQKEAFYKLKTPLFKCRKCYFEPLCQGKSCSIRNIINPDSCFKIRDFFINGLRLNLKTGTIDLEEVLI